MIFSEEEGRLGYRAKLWWSGRKVGVHQAKLAEQRLPMALNVPTIEYRSVLQELNVVNELKSVFQ